MTRFVNLISGKWAIPILYRLIVLNTPCALAICCGRCAHYAKELTKQLRLFEQRGLVSRTVYPEIPPRVEYQITELGLTLQGRFPAGRLDERVRRPAGALNSGLNSAVPECRCAHC
jgi:hypothetical protein